MNCFCSSRQQRQDAVTPVLRVMGNLCSGRHKSVSVPAAGLVKENTRLEIIPVLLDLGDVEVENHKCLVFAHTGRMH